jgi:hypothetical protein
MILRTPAVNYLLAHLSAALKGEHSDDAELPPCPSTVEIRELQAAVDFFLAEMRGGLVGLGEQITNDPQLRRAIDAEIDRRPDRITAGANQIIGRIA